MKFKLNKLCKAGFLGIWLSIALAISPLGAGMDNNEAASGNGAAATAGAMPVISGLSGSIVHNQSVTITGSGFGAKAQAAPLMWDNFENGVVGNDLGNSWYIENRGGPYAKYANDIVRTGSSISVKQDYTFPGQDNTLFGLTGLSTSQKYYVTFWKYITISGGACRNYKPLSFRGGVAGNWDAPRFRHDIYPSLGDGDDNGHLYAEDCVSGDLANKWTNAYNYPRGTWNRVEYYIDTGDPGVANGSWYYWWDSQLRSSYTNVMMRTGDCYYTNLYFNGFFARDENDAAAYIWNDDVYVDTTQARVEIGNASTWAACTHREIQIPTAWSDNSITTTVNQGSFSNGQTAYLYVVGANGNVNQEGYPITFSAPAAPVCEATGSGKCYYISHETGNDANNGSFATPWKTMKNIVWYGTGGTISTPKPSTWVDIKPGDYIYVLNGTYSEIYYYMDAKYLIYFRGENGTEANQFHFKAYPGHKPIIDPNFQSRGIYLLQSSYWNIDGFEVRNSYDSGIRIEEDANIKISNVTVHDTDGVDNSNMAGLFVTGWSNIEVFNSVFYDNYDRTCADTGGNATKNSANVVFLSPGIQENIIFRDNLVYNSVPTSAQKSGTCLKHKHMQQNPEGYFKVYNNTFRNCKFCAVCPSTSNVYAHHNIIINSDYAFESENQAGPTRQVNQNFEYNTIYNVLSGFNFDVINETTSADPKNINFKNNIVYESRTTGSQEQGTVTIATYRSDELYNKTVPELHFSDNCYYNPNTPLRFNLFAAGGNWGNLGGSYNLTQWQALTNNAQPLNYDTNSINADPLFINPAANDFRLQAGSPCSNMGAYIMVAIPGDLNGDNKVSIADIQLCIKVILGTETNDAIVQKAKELAAPYDAATIKDIQAIIAIILGGG